MSDDRCKHNVFLSHRCVDCEQEVTVEDGLRFQIDQLEAERDNLRKQLERSQEDRDELRKKLDDSRAMLESANQCTNDALDKIWQIMYPGKSDWGYPAQVYRHIKALADELRKKLEWQPMETAPKDTTLLLHDQLGGLTLAYYCEQMECWLAATGDLSTSDEHTGWMRPWEAKK